MAVTGMMKPRVTVGSPKERVIAFFQRTPNFSQYSIVEIAEAVDLPVQRVNGAVTSLRQQGNLAGEERKGTKYFRWKDTPPDEE